MRDASSGDARPGSEPRDQRALFRPVEGPRMAEDPIGDKAERLTALQHLTDV